MKCCLRGNQSAEYLRRADQIKLTPRNISNLLNYIDLYPHADLIIEGKIDEKDLAECSRMNKIHFGKNNKNVILSVENPNSSLLDEIKRADLMWYYAYPVFTFYDARGLREAGACSIIIGPPLTHSLDEFMAVGFDEVRVVANVAQFNYTPHSIGIYGGFIRPEDIELYEPYIDTIEFRDCDKEKEQALFRIYMEEHNWPGDLNLIINNLNFSTTNRMIPEKFAERRMNCGQGCQAVSSCQRCYRLLKMADPSLLRPYLRKEVENT